MLKGRRVWMAGRNLLPAAFARILLPLVAVVPPAPSRALADIPPEPSPAVWRMPLDWGPLLSWMVDADGNERVRMAGPLWERADGPNGQMMRAMPRPLYSRAADPATDRASWDCLWPVASGKTFGDQRSWRCVNMFVFDRDLGDPESQYRFWFLPLWFHGRDEDGVRYAAFFPLGGEIRNILWRDRIRFVLWPLWTHSLVKDVETTDVLWPVYSRTTTPDGRVRKFRVFPLYAWSHNARHYDKHSVLWPVWNHARYVHPQAEGTAWVLFPVAGRVNLNTQKGWMFLPPLFQHIRGEQMTRTFFPWPFYQRERGYRDRLSIWPLYGYRVDGVLKRSYWLWPIVTREKNEWGRRSVVRWTVVPFYSSISHSDLPLPSERRAAEEAGEPLPRPQVRGNRTKVWPLYSRRYDLDQEAYRLRLLDLWPGPHPPAVERNWAPVWTLLDYRARGGDSDFEVLWGLYRATRRDREGRVFSLFPLWRHERAADDSDRRWSVLKGLIAYDRTATTRRVRFLWAGRLRLAAPAADAEKP